MLGGDTEGTPSVCYDREALQSRKAHKPPDSAVGMAAAMGIDLLTETQYRELQQLGEFDRKTSSWMKTLDDIRQLGGALFCDRRFSHVFVYHNGAESTLEPRASGACCACEGQGTPANAPFSLREIVADSNVRIA